MKFAYRFNTLCEIYGGITDRIKQSKGGDRPWKIISQNICKESN